MDRGDLTGNRFIAVVKTYSVYLRRLLKPGSELNVSILCSLGGKERQTVRIICNNVAVEQCYGGEGGGDGCPASWF